MEPLPRAQTNLRASGALLDSVVDRYSEGFLFLGVLIYFYTLASLLGIILAFGAWFGSILVSYVRARAEGLRVTCKVGLMQRPERIVLLGAGALLQGVLWHRFPIVQTNAVILLCVPWGPHTHDPYYCAPSAHFLISSIEPLTAPYTQPN